MVIKIKIKMFKRHGGDGRSDRYSKIYFFNNWYDMLHNMKKQEHVADTATNTQLYLYYNL